jgi:hypothetical protein
MGDFYILLELNRDPELRTALAGMLTLPPPDTIGRAPSLQEVNDETAALGRIRFHTGQRTLDIDIDASLATNDSQATLWVKSLETEAIPPRRDDEPVEVLFHTRSHFGHPHRRAIEPDRNACQ